MVIKKPADSAEEVVVVLGTFDEKEANLYAAYYEADQRCVAHRRKTAFVPQYVVRCGTLDPNGN